MKNAKIIKNIIAKNKGSLKEKYKVKTIGIFGSYARGNPGKKSDVDILVDFSESPDMFEFIKLEDYLSNLIRIKVDLITKKALKPLIRDEILKATLYI